MTSLLPLKNVGVNPQRLHSIDGNLKNFSTEYSHFQICEKLDRLSSTIFDSSKVAHGMTEKSDVVFINFVLFETSAYALVFSLAGGSGGVKDS